MFINSWWGAPYDGDDPFNRNNSRNLKNTNRTTYNCAGYALNTFSWYLPCPDDVDDLDDVEWGAYDEIEQNAMAFRFVTQILNDFPTARLIGSVDELNDDEYAFAFRVGVDDFHFVKRAKNGQWYAKNGSNPRIERMSERDVFHSEWEDGRYNGAIFLFANRCSADEASIIEEKNEEETSREELLSTLFAVSF